MENIDILKNIKNLSKEEIIALSKIVNIEVEKQDDEYGYWYNCEYTYSLEDYLENKYNHDNFRLIIVVR